MKKFLTRSFVETRAESAYGGDLVKVQELTLVNVNQLLKLVRSFV